MSGSDIQSATRPPQADVALRCGPIELLVLDVDGVLTDGGIEYSSGGEELKRFHVRDGSGLKIWREAGKRAAVITGRKSPVVERRAAELGLEPVFQGVADKLTAFRRIFDQTAVTAVQVCYVGDDLPDVPVLRNCGLPIAVADACAEACEDALYVTVTPGGRGAIREVIELILRCQGHWTQLVNRYRGETL